MGGDELDDLIRQGREGSKWMFWEDQNGRRHTSAASVDALLTELADALESLRPRTITTVEELDALAMGSVVRQAPEDSERVENDDGSWSHGAIAELRPDRGGRKAWFLVGYSLGFRSHQADLLPATVLYTPTEGDKT